MACLSLNPLQLGVTQNHHAWFWQRKADHASLKSHARFWLSWNCLYSSVASMFLAIWCILGHNGLDIGTSPTRSWWWPVGSVGDCISYLYFCWSVASAIHERPLSSCRCFSCCLRIGVDPLSNRCYETTTTRTATSAKQRVVYNWTAIIDVAVYHGVIRYAYEFY